MKAAGLDVRVGSISPEITEPTSLQANDGQTLVSEGIDANYLDIFNYAAFALILMDEGKH